MTDIDFFDTIVIGTGCAGYNAVDWLHTLGRTNIAIVTEGRLCGTSRNTGSDKQTYYKLSVAGDERDSVRDMAEDLSRDRVNGDTALAEAAGSVQCFMKLANLGVPFPVNPYGEFVGYRTDHDQRRRATSAGPLTSKYMTEALESSVLSKGIKLFDKLRMVKIIAPAGKVEGLICISTVNGAVKKISCNNIILATGGSAGVYKDTVYPESQSGGLAAAYKAGASFTNLNEWQYGLASVRPKWNLSGSYQQCLPKYVSLDRDGVWREFLPDYFDTPENALNMVFLKGYEWPFDAAKVKGSSVIDLIVEHEIYDLQRRVFLDFRTDPMGLENGLDGLSNECREYLYNCGAVHTSPISRLRKINSEAVELFKSKGVDISAQLLEIALCAQHHNGGISVDANWETAVSGLYAVGECAGTFGAARPGGAALNSAQVGSMRAAQHIVYTKPQTEPHILLKNFEMKFNETPENHLELREKFAEKLSRFASVKRDRDRLEEIQIELKPAIKMLGNPDTAEGQKTLDLLITDEIILSAMRLSAENDGSRGSALVLGDGGELVLDIEYLPPTGAGNMLIETGKSGSAYKKTRPMPEDDSWFERVWYYYRVRTGR